MTKRIAVLLAVLAACLGLTGGTANASFTQGYFRNDSCVGYNQCAGVGLTVWPNYSGYQVIVPPNGTHSNITGNPAPENGDLVYIYVGPGWRCTVDKWDLNYPGEGTYGRLLSRRSDVSGYIYAWYSSHSWLYTIWACHQG